MTPRATAMLLAVGGAGAALWAAALPEVVHNPLRSGLESALARALGVERSTVSIGRAWLGWPGRLIVDDVAAGGWAATRIEVDVDPWAALDGRLVPSRARARDLFCDLGAVDAAEATWAHGRARIRLERMTLMPLPPWLGGLPVALAQVGIDVDGGTARRLAFTGARVGAVDGLAGAAARAPDGSWLVRASKAGLRAGARVAPQEVEGEVELDRYDLGRLPAPRGVDLGAAAIDGTVGFTVARAGARATLDLRVDGVALDQRALARTRIDGVAATLTGALAVADGAIVAERLRIGVGRAALVLDGRWGRDGRLELSATLPAIACAELLASLPPSLAPHLLGLALDGDVAAALTARGQIGDGAPLLLGLDGNLGCRVRTDAPLADVGALPATLARHLADGRPFALLPRNPSWRALDELPPSLVRAFVVAEDGRFFAHHGFDLVRIGGALGADLVAQRFARGASTITQQVAKNLWLDGERSLSRKLEEAVLAWRLEQVLDKRRILELYLNLVELGPGVWGVADAAERYFGKLPEELSSDEAAQLAALLPAPRRGMDAAWQWRYRALAARLPSEKVPMPAPVPVKLSRR
jgi:hypothetical protein